MRYYHDTGVSPFRNLDAFETGYIPEIFNFRDSQMKDLAYALHHGLIGNSPVNMVLRGLPGTGKSTTVYRIFSELEETPSRIVPVYVNCQLERSQFAVFAKIFGKLHGHQPPPSGTPIRQVVYDIGKTLHEKKLVLLVCFDDANYLFPGKVLNDVLYILLRLHGEYPDARAGVILPMSDMDADLRAVLDPSVFSVLRPDTIHFPPYNEVEIDTILRDRMKIGLNPGVITPDVFDCIIRHTMRSGDVRVGLDLVKRSVMAAERAGMDVVTRDHVEASFDLAKHAPLDASIQALCTDERKLYGHIAGMSLDTGAILTSGAVFESVKRYMPISYTAFYEKLRKLDEMRLIELIFLRGRGTTREIALRYDAEKVMKLTGYGE